jgi:hypothetical protein
MHVVKIAEALGAVVDAGVLPGAATLVWRDGRVAAAACVGLARH